ncbi:MAG: DUF2007 domain-containing protein [Bacteroidales bacterium]|nr:DUF2007 domain-containing protein [Bacteroidales bacterium]MDD3663993.1 DUF2007 domain-containing protein [Bacteroidales bacterium]
MENFVTVISFTYPHQAHLAKGFLESNEIETIIQDEFTVQVNNFYSNAIGGVKLLVAESNYDKSILLLKKSGYIQEDGNKEDNKVEILELNENTNTKICPFCKSENINRNKKISIIVIPIYLILGTLLPIFGYTDKCFDCNKEWRYKK